MVQWLGVLATLPVDQSSIPSTHMMAHIWLLFQLQGIQHFQPLMIPVFVPIAMVNNLLSERRRDVENSHLCKWKERLALQKGSSESKPFLFLAAVPV